MSKYGILKTNYRSCAVPHMARPFRTDRAGRGAAYDIKLYIEPMNTVPASKTL